MKAPCFYCTTPLTENAEGIWVDDTDGDCCWGDDNNVNENEPHEPALMEATFTGVVYIRDMNRDEWRNIATVYRMKDAMPCLNYWRGRGYDARLVEQIVQEWEILV